MDVKVKLYDERDPGLQFFGDMLNMNKWNEFTLEIRKGTNVQEAFRKVFIGKKPIGTTAVVKTK